MAISKIIADSITDEAVTSAKIATGTVIAADIADGTVTNAKIDTVANTKITGVITNAQLANTTGSGAVVLTTSPTLVTPALGTPSALVGTNISGTGASFTAGSVTNNANLTGHVTSVGNAAVLGSFTSAQLAAALSNETGSGLAVFGTSPNLITPILGTPTSGDLTNCTGYASANMPTGSVLQVVTTQKTDTFSTSSTSFVAITGISVSITPRSTSSRISVQVSFGNASAASATYTTAFRVMRGSTAIGVGDAVGSRPRASFKNVSAGSDHSSECSFLWIDSPSSVSSLTYTVEAQAQTPETFYLNRTATDSDGTSAYQARCASSITVMEIQG